MKPLLLLAAAAVVVAAAAGCGGSSSVNAPTVAPAATYDLVHLTPSGPVVAGKPVRISFSIQQPDGTDLTRFKTGPGPHTGIHLILVRKDLAYIIHEHPPVGGSKTITKTVVFPAPGPYRMVVDVYPATETQQVNANFQLFAWIQVKGSYAPKALPPPASVTTVDGYRFTLTGAGNLKAIDPALVTVHVVGPGGKLPSFTPWFGALAHAIFFRKTSLDYFHTHVCSANVSGCTSVIGGAKVTGRSTTPGKLSVGVLVPAPGIWRLFLQCKVDGTILTAPFTLHVH